MYKKKNTKGRGERTAGTGEIKSPWRRIKFFWAHTILYVYYPGRKFAVCVNMYAEKNCSWYSVRPVWCGVVWCGVVWCGVVWCGVVFYARHAGNATRLLRLCGGPSGGRQRPSPRHGTSWLVCRVLVWIGKWSFCCGTPAWHDVRFAEHGRFFFVIKASWFLAGAMMKLDRATRCIVLCGGGAVKNQPTRFRPTARYEALNHLLLLRRQVPAPWWCSVVLWRRTRETTGTLRAPLAHPVLFSLNVYGPVIIKDFPFTVAFSTVNRSSEIALHTPALSPHSTVAADAAVSATHMEHHMSLHSIWCWKTKRNYTAEGGGGKGILRYFCNGSEEQAGYDRGDGRRVGAVVPTTASYFSAGPIHGAFHRLFQSEKGGWIFFSRAWSNVSHGTAWVLMTE